MTPRRRLSFAPRKARVCKFFSDAGEPIGEGCPRPANVCRFMHPEDREWPYGSDGRLLRSPTRPLKPTRRGTAGGSRKRRSRSRSRSWSRSRSRSRSPERSRWRDNYSTSRRPSTSPENKGDRGGRESRSDWFEKPTATQEGNAAGLANEADKTFSAVPSSVPPDVPSKVDKRQQRDRWTKKLGALSDAVHVCIEHESVNDDVVHLEALQGLKDLGVGPEGGVEPSLLHVGRDILLEQSKQRDGLVSELESLVDKIVLTDTGEELELEAGKSAYSDAIKYVEELKTKAEAMSDLLRSLMQEKEQPEVDDSDEEDVDSSSRKRKKKGEAAQAILAAPEIVDKALAAQEKFTQLQDYIDQQEERVREAVYDALDAWTEDYESAGSANSDEDASIKARSPEPDLSDGQLAHINSEILRATDDTHEMGNILRGWSGRLDALQAHASPAPQPQSSRGRLAELLAQQEESARSISALQNAFSALATVSAQQAQPPPKEPSVSDSEVVFRAIEDGLRESLRTSLMGVVEEFRLDVQGKWEQQAGKMYTDTLDKADKLDVVLDAIESKLGDSDKRPAAAGPS